MPEPAHPITIEQDLRGITVRSPTCPDDAAVFRANEVVEGRHFSPRSCAGFRARVNSIWGPDGSRTLVPRVAKLRENGTPYLAPEDRYGFFPMDGKFGRHPDAAGEPE